MRLTPQPKAKVPLSLSREATPELRSEAAEAAEVQPLGAIVSRSVAVRATAAQTEPEASR